MANAIAQQPLVRRRGASGLNIALWIVSGLLAMLFITSGGAKLLGRMTDEFVAWGYPAGVAAMIGILEVVGAVGLLAKRTAGWSALGLMVIMAGAAWTHAVHDERVALATPIIVFAALAFVAWGRGLAWTTREPEAVEMGPQT